MTTSGSDGHATRCAGIRARVYEFLDEELPLADRDRIHAHLVVCPPCDRHFAYERIFLAVLHKRTTIEQAPAELRERIRAAIAGRESPRRRS